MVEHLLPEIMQTLKVDVATDDVVLAPPLSHPDCMAWAVCIELSAGRSARLKVNTVHGSQLDIVARAEDLHDRLLNDDPGHAQVSDLYFELLEGRVTGYASLRDGISIVRIAKAIATEPRLIGWDNAFADHINEGYVGSGHEGILFARDLIALLPRSRGDRLLRRCPRLNASGTDR